mmetsp:Transcript_86443/g.167493  ORF Transcript_86443/g.167493 Transcript_86443/m.167493 type:complete len:281 (-) Transcript_86443:234-1076(-)
MLKIKRSSIRRRRRHQNLSIIIGIEILQRATNIIGGDSGLYVIIKDKPFGCIVIVIERSSCGLSGSSRTIFCLLLKRVLLQGHAHLLKVIPRLPVHRQTFLLAMLTMTMMMTMVVFRETLLHVFVHPRPFVHQTLQLFHALQQPNHFLVLPRGGGVVCGRSRSGRAGGLVPEDFGHPREVRSLLWRPKSGRQRTFRSRQLFFRFFALVVGNRPLLVVPVCTLFHGVQIGLVLVALRSVPLGTFGHLRKLSLEFFHFLLVVHHFYGLRFLRNLKCQAVLFR